MPFFERKERISRMEFRNTLRKRNPIVLGTYRKLFSFPERKEMEKKLFGRKIKAHTSKEKYKRLIHEVGRKKYKTTDVSKRWVIDKKIRLLRKLGGV